MLKEMKFMNDIYQQKKHRTQSKYGENIGEENNIRVSRNRKNGRDAVHGK